MIDTARAGIADEMSAPHTRSAVGFPIMGTRGHVVTIGAEAPPIDELVAELRSLERRWTRFDEDSELSRLNRSGGRPCIVGHPTAVLVDASLHGWRRSGGRFDPTVLQAMHAAGYDQTFAELPALVERRPCTPSPGCDGIEVDVQIDLIRLPPDVALDAGGIGKGLAADLVAVAAVEAGADAAMVSLGGDLRVAGDAPADGLEVELDHHVVAPARINLRSGAVATSSTLVRRWSSSDGVAHHVIDPRTGRPLEGPAVACSVVAAQAWWAEVLATTILVGWTELDHDAELDELLVGAGALVTLADGSQRAVGPYAASFSPGADDPEVQQ